MDKTQRQIMLVMPLFFVIFIISFPAGVIVYWITTNTWTIGQQYIVKRRLGPIGPAGVTHGRGAAPARRRSRLADGGRRLRRVRWQRSEREPAAAAGGLGGLLRGRNERRTDGSVARAPQSRRTAPPPPPRKKKKRSGRRR